MKLKYKVITCACALALSASAWAELEVTVQNNSNFLIQVPTGNVSWPGVTSQQSAYIGRDSFQPDTPDTDWPTPPPTGQYFGPGQSSSSFNFGMDHVGGDSLGNITTELQLNIYSQQQSYIGTCYLINANNGNGQGLELNPLGYVSEYDYYLPSFPIPPNYAYTDNQCPWLNLTISPVTGAVNPHFTATLSPGASIPTIVAPISMTPLLLATNYQGKGQNLYRIDLQSAVYQTGTFLNNFFLDRYDISSHGTDHYFLPPLKVLNVQNNAANNAYQYQESNSDFYILSNPEPGPNDVYTWPQLNAPQSGWTGSAGASFANLPDPTVGYNSSDFAIALTPLLPSVASANAPNVSTVSIYDNGMDQVPLRVSIYYEPNGTGGSTPSSNYIISPYYYPNLMYLYKQVYFETYQSNNSNSDPAFLNNLEPAGNANDYTVVSNYPGPYVTVPGGDMFAANSYAENDPSSYQRPQIYFLSTTSTDTIYIGAALSINGHEIDSVDSQGDGMVTVNPEAPPSESLQQSGHLVNAIATPSGEKSYSVPIYNTDLFNAQNSTAVYMDQANDQILGMSNYEVYGTSTVNNLSGFVNSDGSFSIPDLNSNGELNVVDIYGNRINGQMAIINSNN